MPSRISQMRNEQWRPNQQQPQAQFQINENYLNQLKTIMHSNNSQQLLANMAAQNPLVKQIFQIAQNGGNLKLLFEQLAQQMNADPNIILQKLMG